jgi:iron-sulfur cluster assembly protein
MNTTLDTLKEAPVKITEGAINQLRKIKLESQVADDQALRIGVKGGGCSGMTYLLAFDSVTEDDNMYQIEEIQVAMNKAHEMYVIGMQIDYQDGLNSRGFTFTNPNATSTCGCGTSFSA